MLRRFPWLQAGALQKVPKEEFHDVDSGYAWVRMSFRKQFHWNQDAHCFTKLQTEASGRQLPSCTSIRVKDLCSLCSTAWGATLRSSESCMSTCKSWRKASLSWLLRKLPSTCPRSRQKNNWFWGRGLFSNGSSDISRQDMDWASRKLHEVLAEEVRYCQVLAWQRLYGVYSVSLCIFCIICQLFV